MNLLVHYLLSGRDSEIVVGNIIADFLKGTYNYTFTPGIEFGIFLHKQIDQFSDNHPIVRNTWKLLSSNFGFYGRVITDIYFDFCLYQHWKKFSAFDFEEDMEYLYYCFRIHWQVIPPHVRRVVSQIIALQWPKKYTSYHGLIHVFRSMSRRVSFQNNFEHAVDILKNQYNKIEKNFLKFYPEIYNYVTNISKTQGHDKT